MVSVHAVLLMSQFFQRKNQSFVFTLAGVTWLFIFSFLFIIIIIILNFFFFNFLKGMGLDSKYIIRERNPLYPSFCIH